MTPLAERLAARIAAAGPMSVAEYMAACLGDPDHGYYRSREPFGVAGDFVTAPEVSQVFGELIGLWCVATWQDMGAPKRFALVELGPGRGTLMADMLRAARLRPEFLSAVEVHLVETSPRLREAQRTALQPSGIKAAWHDDIAGLPALPAIVVANEFFDALPIRQFVRTGEGWAERMIGLDENGQLAFGLLPTTFAERTGTPTGSIVEQSPAALGIMERLAGAIAINGGAALVIDYGYSGPATGDTLQAVRGHRYDGVLAAPGEADITAHVDFAALAAAARRAGARAAPLLTQGTFLMRLGLRERFAALVEGKDDATRAALAADAARLAGENGMGRLFKALGIAAPGLRLPAFDLEAETDDDA
jgi:NADH dehydrogenase [ubiquinone] 1 alpha subcomplex assembly factor 7